MEKIELICVGTVREPALKQLISEYHKRLSRFCALNTCELSEYALKKENSAQISRALESEGAGILKRMDGYSIALCIEGKSMSSIDFSDFLASKMLEHGRLNFIIGSSYGLSEAVKQKSNFKLSLSDMTFPHQLTRLLLLEQIYRAYKIRSNQKYNK
jgi:ribosomal RNA large subunit methyltransferase H